MPYNVYVDVLETFWLGWLLYYYATLAVSAVVTRRAHPRNVAVCTFALLCISISFARTF
jgi:hypothetical protein